MKPSVAKLCLKNLHLYSIQFSDPRMVADDGTIQTFNGVLCDLAPVGVCDWWRNKACTKTRQLWSYALPRSVEHWAGLGFAWGPRNSEGITTKRALVKWLKSQAKGGE